MATVKKSSVLGAITRYYNTLSYLGGVPQSDVNKILVALLLIDFVNTDLSFFVTEKDYDSIGKLYRMIIGNCLLPYDQFCMGRTNIGSPMLHVEGLGVMRVTEDEGDERYVEVGSANRMIENLTWFTKNGL